MEHIPGKPIFKLDDYVSFKVKYNEKEYLCEGKIVVIDSYGAWEIENPREPSYDVLVDNWLNAGSECLVKHNRESALTLIKKFNENKGDKK